MADIVPTVPTTPVIGGSNNRKLPVSEVRKNILQKIYQARKPIYQSTTRKTVQTGSLVTFNYLHWKHDPYPLVLCAKIYQDGKVAGVNLHYLTFKYIKYLINQFCGKQFDYQFIKGDSFINNSYRSYHRKGINNPRIYDCEFLNTILGTVRSFNPNEIEAIRKEVEIQLRNRLQKTADELVNEYMESLVPNSESARNKLVQGYESQKNYGQELPDKRFNPKI